MKKLTNIVIIGLLLTVFGAQIQYAQANDASTLKSVLKSLLDYSKSKAYDKAAGLIAYEGDDKNRINKDSFNPNYKEELNQVKRICKKISALLELSGEHKLGEPKSSEGSVYTLQVTFISGEQKLTTTFTFEKTEKGFLLTGMN